MTAARRSLVSLTPARREMLLRLAAAAFGMALAVSMLSLWARPAPAGQAAGYMTAANLDAHGPMRFILTLIGFPFAAAFAFGPLARRMAGDEVQAWARNAFYGAVLITLWLAAWVDRPLLVSLPVVLLLPVCFLLRHFDAQFSRRDVILLPTILTTYFSLLDVLPGTNGVASLLLAAGSIFALRLAVARVTSGTTFPPALAFAFSPLGFAFQTQLNSPRERHLGWPSLALAILTPMVLVFALRRTPATVRRLLAVVAFGIYPLVSYAYPLTISSWSAESKPRVNFFEAAHPLLPASEMLRGELPYRDTLPGHGLIEDGFLDFLALRYRGATIGDAMKTHAMIGNLTSVATYAAAFAATGSPEAGLLTLFLAIALPSAAMSFLRSMAALFALAFMLRAARRRLRRDLFRAGMLAALAVFVSLDFGAYALITLALTSLRFGSTLREKLLACRDALLGILAVTIPAFVVLAVYGILDDFIHGTLVEVLSLGPVYAIGFFHPPPTMAALRYFPDVLIAFLHHDSLFYGVWIAGALTAATLISREPLRGSRRWEPLVILCTFVTITAISYAERHHTYDNIVAPVLFVLAAFMLFRSRSGAARRLAPVAVLLLLAIANPTAHFAVSTQMRLTRGFLDDNVTEIWDVPRARGALFTRADAGRVASMKRYLESHLTPGETFFDFTNRGLAYFLFDRDCPVRQYEVAFYESDAAQREVIARLDGDRDVRVALMPAAPMDGTVDQIPNAVRAPLVWAYLETHFTPDFQEGDVVFWKRKGRN
jgi:hypothetical protein